MCLSLRLGSVLVALGLSACGTISVSTNPNNYSVEPNAVAHLRAPQTVALKNAYPAEVEARFEMRYHTLAVEQKQLTETAISMLARSLEKQGLGKSEQAEKTVTLRVRAQGYTVQMFRYTGKVVLEALLGDGTVLSVPNESMSPKGWENAFDGAVLFALNDLLQQEQFVAYINK